MFWSYYSCKTQRRKVQRKAACSKGMNCTCKRKCLQGWESLSTAQPARTKKLTRERSREQQNQARQPLYFPVCPEVSKDQKCVQSSSPRQCGTGSSCGNCIHTVFPTILTYLTVKIPSPWIQTLHRGNYALRRGEGLFKTDWTYLNQTWITKPNFKNLTAANGNKTIPPYYFCQHNKVIFRIKKKEKLFTAVKTQLRSIYK